ncbi:membrane protein insertase YidC [Sphingomonas lutea]|uniref:Membrane protein insertase YidC n=1 Tax=Sphingomonas lutea TaxID=1045317 RepID=A0A7G9SG18_9SPHN|nr:membrane protein insertase YidC [Sphingomonas lutea]QNN66793.1 membrane protein insertase YidC [Sphingomonas lutea]
MSDSKNMILAVVLSALVLLGWSWLADSYFPTAAPQSTTVENGKVQPAPQAQTQAPGSPVATSPTVMRSRNAVLASTPRIRIQTPSLQGSINLQGAQVDDLTMVRHRATIDRSSQPVRLFSPLGAPGAYIATFGWTGQGVQVPGPDTVWTADRQLLSPGQPVTLTTQMPDGMRYAMRISVDDGYVFTVEQQASNGSGKPAIVRPIGLVSRAAKSNDPDSWTVHVGPMSVFGGTADYDVDWDTVDEAGPGGTTFNDVRGWLGFTDTYWLAALAPAGDAPMDAAFRRSPSGGYQADYALPATIVPAGDSITNRTRLFAGAKEKAALDRADDAGITKLSKSIDWGWFEFFMRPIFDLLTFLFRSVGNFGVAIIILTFIVRLVMFPIAQKQFQSMAAMRKLQPKLKAVQDKWKDDKARQQQEILKLYQAEKVNPAAGCLPILIQIPIFYALYKVLLVSVEMRHQPFALWIRDLSAPDPLTPVNLFGLLDFTPPAILAIGVLPILVGASQWLSIKLSPQSPDPTQRQIFAIMPWVLIFAMAPFAAGLQLYWLTNNILSIAQQWWLYRRFGLSFSDTHPVEE